MKEMTKKFKPSSERSQEVEKRKRKNERMREKKRKREREWRNGSTYAAKLSVKFP